MELRQIECFVAVAELRHFTKAAGKLHLSQPTVSSHIRRLEEDLGTPLLLRSQRQVSLTAEGASFLRTAERILALVQEYQSGAAETHKTQQIASIAVGVLPAVAATWFPEFLQAMAKKLPHVRITAYEGTTAELLLKLEAQELHLAIITLTQRLHSFQLTALYEEPLHLITSKHHPLTRQATQKALAISDLAGEGFLQNESELGHIVEDTCHRSGLFPHWVLRNCRTASLKRFAAQNLGIGLLPASLVDSKDLRRLAITPLSDGPLRQIGVALRGGQAPSVDAQSVVRELSGYFAPKAKSRSAPSNLASGTKSSDRSR